MNDKKELFRLVDDRFVRVPPIGERIKVLTECHDGHGHFGQEAIWKRLYHYYWWPISYEDYKKFIKSCELCQLRSYTPERVASSGIVSVHKPFERFSIDCVGPFPNNKDKNKYIIMAVEYLLVGRLQEQ